MFTVRCLPLRAEFTFYSESDYSTFHLLSPTFQKCRIFVPNVTLCAFRARCCGVLYPTVFRYFSLIFPFLKRKKSGKRSNNERINDGAWEFRVLLDCLIAWKSWELKVESWKVSGCGSNFQFSTFNFQFVKHSSNISFSFFIQSSNQRGCPKIKGHSLLHIILRYYDFFLYLCFLLS